jgi:multiple sugar transport system permease protein
MVEATSRRLISTILLNVVVAIGGIIMVAPLVWMISASFKPLNEIYAYPPTIIPQNFTLANFTRLVTDWPFGTWYLNSLLVALLVTIAVLFFTSLAGFGFQLILVPLFIFMSQLSWTNSYFALVVPFMAPAVGIFLMRQFILSIPSELIEAARIDGASEFTIYWRVVLPLTRPALAAQAVLTFLGSWNSFLWPLAVLHNQDTLTLPVGLANMIGGVTAGSEPPIGASMAAATLVTVPVILIFIAVQKQYIAGLTAASVKQ